MNTDLAVPQRALAPAPRAAAHLAVVAHVAHAVHKLGLQAHLADRLAYLDAPATLGLGPQSDCVFQNLDFFFLTSVH